MPAPAGAMALGMSAPMGVSQLLEIAILGLLNESPMHGYELRKRLSGLLGTFRAFSYGSLYPTLRKLSEAGWTTEEEVTPTAGAGGRARRGKRVYMLTAEGKERLAELLSEVGPDAFDDEGFGARLAFFAQTRSDIRMQILEGRRRRVEEQRDGMKSALARTRERLDRYTLELQEHGLESVDREVRWLNELIENEKTSNTSTQRTTNPKEDR
ncbi:PadR family transcriptional regulator [Jatrophihabitans sp. GAS493]|uniref:PadR family transcriptional regulator n=1 Tax=Jatrophihabitans sp. GAS493 TaxID=1907575 RepID=UPI001F534944|nr:PadR family transcriptional regulator [Jatrophihabitans sp. GAS493]